MANAKENKAEGTRGSKPSVMPVIIPVLLLTLIAGGGGFAVATMVGPNVATAPQAEVAASDGDHVSKPEEGAVGNERGTNTGIIRQLAPIVTNLASPKDVWMRIEVSIVIKPEAKAEQDLIAVRSSDQILALLRTIDLAQIEGPSGFLHFREDVNDLVRESSEHKVAQVLINSMVVE
ncbi:MAG: flagellar basal body-associated FliL family protein [Aestuariivirga sp.]|nr:flagellar basal body-associated FliL family protein [Aestuariivirga sp.]